MDCESVTSATDGDLHELGLIAKGDILALKSFCKTRPSKESRDDKKRKLIDMIKGNNKSAGRKAKIDSTEKAKEKDRKVSVGWLHYNECSNRYALVRASKGGGSRQISIPLKSSKKDMIALLRDLYFPNGKSQHGLDFDLGDFKYEIIDPPGAFTLQSYLTAHKLQRPKLFLMTKTRVDNCIDNSDSTSDEELPPAFHVTQLQTISSATEISDDAKKLQEQRQGRVAPEPDITEEHVLVSVRHVESGDHVRAFRLNEKVSAVYDWIGSLSPLPKYFHLYLQQPRRLLSPSEDITVATKQKLNMCMAELPPPLDPDDSVIDVMGFGPVQIPVLETSNNVFMNDLPEPSAALPNQILVDDSE